MTVLYIFYIFWLCAVLAFLFLIWWSTTRYIRKMETTMIASRAISAEAALKSAEAAAKLADMLEKEHHA
jgi:hypothetical protein